MACGRLVLVRDGVEGLLFDPNSPQDIADAIYRFINLTIDEKIMMGRNARAFAEQAFDNRVYIAKYEKLFNEIIKQK